MNFKPGDLLRPKAAHLSIVIVIMFPSGRVEKVNSCELMILKEAE